MIIISNKNIENSVLFPKNLYAFDFDTYSLVLTNRGTNKQYTFENLEDKHTAPYGFYTMFVNFSNLPIDEYEYTLFGEWLEVSKGIIKLMNGDQNTIYYDKNRDYIVYEQ